MDPEDFEVESAVEMPEAFLDLFDKKTVAHLATKLPDGTPHVTSVWIDYDGTYLLVNTAEGRQKERNVRNDPDVGLSVPDPENPYRYLSVLGVVEEVTPDGADGHIDELARRYMDGVSEYPYHGQEVGQRVILKIRPQKCITYTTSDERLNPD